MELNKKKKITKRRYRPEQPDALTPALSLTLSRREREDERIVSTYITAANAYATRCTLPAFRPATHIRPLAIR